MKIKVNVESYRDDRIKQATIVSNVTKAILKTVPPKFEAYLQSVPNFVERSPDEFTSKKLISLLSNALIDFFLKS